MSKSAKLEPATPDRLDRGVVSHAVIDDVDELKDAFRKFDINPIRVGPSRHPTRTTTVTRERLAFTACELGFPTLTSTTVSHDRLAVGFVRTTPPGSRWCEIDLEPGDVVVWSPSAEHNARNVPGLELLVAQIDLEQIEARAEDLGIPFRSPAPGEVRLLAPSSAEADGVSQALSNYGDVASTGVIPGMVYEDDMLLAAAHAAAGGKIARRIGYNKRIDSRDVIRSCLDYADAIGRIPSISELCAASYVSERRLRQAFTTEFGVPPSRFFRAWALAEAHRRLSSDDLGTPTVTDIALDLGFEHLGRFSGHYLAVYGEAPSATIRRASVGST